jgi:hypothetical protein
MHLLHTGPWALPQSMCSMSVQLPVFQLFGNFMKLFQNWHMLMSLHFKSNPYLMPVVKVLNIHTEFHITTLPITVKVIQSWMGYMRTKNEKGLELAMACFRTLDQYLPWKKWKKHEGPQSGDQPLGWESGLNPGGGEIFPPCQTGPIAHPVSHVMGTRCLSLQQSSQGMALTTHTTT